MIRLAENLQIDLSVAAGQKLAVIGKSGSGKSNTLARFTEQWVDNGLPVTVIDPMGEFARLPLRALIAGRGKTAHVEITPANAAALARLAAGERISVVLDMSLYRDDEALSILHGYLDTQWQARMMADNPEAAALVIDEAHLFAPQVGQTVLSELIHDMAKRGRHLNLTTFVATQRPASLNKNFLTQANLLIAHRLSFGVDTKILQEQLALPVKELNGMMRKLATGQALVIGDSSLVGDADYLNVQVDPSGLAALKSGDKSATPAPAPDLSAVLELLKSLPTEPVPVAEDNPALGEMQRRLDAAQIRCEELERELDRRETDLAVKDQIIEQLRALVKKHEAAPALPGLSPVGVIHSANGFQHAATGEALPKEASVVLASRAMQRSADRRAKLIRKQQNAFNTLMRDFRALPALDRNVAALLLDNAGQWMSDSTITARLGYTPGRISKNPPIEAMQLGLIQRKKLPGDGFAYVECIRLLRARFPDLDGDELVNQLIEAGLK